MFLLRIFLIHILIVNLMICDGAKNVVFCKPVTRVGILPFQIYSKEKVDYIRKIISNNLAQQLIKNSQITVVDLKEIDNVLAEKATPKGFTPEELDHISQKTGAHFLVYGSLTKIANTLSLDIRVFTNLNDSPDYKDFVEGEDLNRLTENVGNRISNHIIKSALHLAPEKITAAKSDSLDEKAKTAPLLEETPVLESKPSSPLKSLIEEDEELTIKPPALSEATPTTPDTYSKLAETTAAPKREPRKSKSILSDQPINITSDRMEANNRKRTVTFTGNVVAKREDMVIFSNQLSTFYTKDGEIIKIIAHGNVKINQNDRIATCQEAIFLKPSQKIVLTGNPKVWQGNNIVKGEKITILLNEDKIEIQGGKRNRVNAIIYPMGKNLE